MIRFAREVHSFGSLTDARGVLQATFGYPDFRPPQRRAVEAVLSGKDALIVLPTGGGKSLCYQVPALVRQGLTVVISPLISLMKDQVDALRRRRVAAAFINSTVSSSDVSLAMEQARSGTLRLLYLAPERLEAGRTLTALAGIGVALLAVDEAHCISEWGHDFRPSYRRIGAIRAQLGMPQTVALTATATPDVRTDIIHQLALRHPQVVVGGFDRTNLTYHVARTRSAPEKDRSAIQWLQEARGPAVVYAPTRKAVERLAALLVRARINAVAYHAGLDPGVRQRAQAAFMEERARVIVATSAFGMGIDKPDVRLVVHHAMPGTLEAYYQEAGRAGRDGQPGTCVLLYSHADRYTHEYFLAGSHPGRALVERVWHTLCAHADRTHAVAAPRATLMRSLSAGSDARTVEAALRVLGSVGAVQSVAPSYSRVWIRLTAAPARIARELTGARDFDRELLRALWRAVGRRLESGTLVDLDGLPPGFAGASGVVPVLERLEAEQFVSWARGEAEVRLDPHVVAAGRLPVDWRALAQRHTSDLARLQAVERYAQTRACRRAFVLRYFGDPDARPHCTACDRCLGSTSDAPTRIHASIRHGGSRLRRS